MPSTEDLMRQRFHELRAEIAAIEAVSAPLREQRDGIIAEARALELNAAPVEAQIATAEAGLFEKKRELSLLCTALGGKTALGDA